MTTITLFCRLPSGATEALLRESRKTGHAALAEAILWAHQHGLAVTGTVPAVDITTVIAAKREAFEEAISAIVNVQARAHYGARRADGLEYQEAVRALAAKVTP